MPQPASARLEALLLPVVAAAGLDLEGLDVTAAGRRSVVRLLVDKDGGVTLDDVADVSRAVSEALDAIDADSPELLAGAYVLEVGSPGVDRPLVLPRHWHRNTGRLVRVTRADGGSVTGRVLSADPTATGGALLDVDGSELRVAYAEVARAQVQVEFARASAQAEPAGEADA